MGYRGPGLEGPPAAQQGPFLPISEPLPGNGSGSPGAMILGKVMLMPGTKYVRNSNCAAKQVFRIHIWRGRWLGTMNTGGAALSAFGSRSGRFLSILLTERGKDRSLCSQPQRLMTHALQPVKWKVLLQVRL